MAGLGLVLQRKRRHAVLKRIGEGDQSTFLGDHAAEILRYQTGIVILQVAGITIHLLHELVFVLFVLELVHVVHSAMAEGERAGGDIFAIVVVDCRSGDALVLQNIRLDRALDIAAERNRIDSQVGPRYASFHPHTLVYQASIRYSPT